jgi:hypothetical protein
MTAAGDSRQESKGKAEELANDRTALVAAVGIGSRAV